MAATTRSVISKIRYFEPEDVHVEDQDHLSFRSLRRFHLLHIVALPAALEIEKALISTQEITSPRWIARSMFSADRKQAKPSEYVEFLFSSLGAAERPPVDDGREMPREEPGQGRRGGPKLWPEGVAFVAINPDPRSGKQIVIIPDDEKSEMILRAYLDPAKPPIAERRWRFAPQFRQ